jgi:hypothetical protein
MAASRLEMGSKFLRKLDEQRTTAVPSAAQALGVHHYFITTNK